jgi:uncharacterized RDD family membrane protein YckC
VLVGFAPLIDQLSSRFDPSPWGRSFVAMLMYSLVASVYEVVFLSIRGQTPGKDLLDLKVVVRGTVDHPSWSTSVLRVLPIAVLRVVPPPLVGACLVGVLGVSSPIDRDRRGLHDLLAGTIVISFDADEDDIDEPVPEIDRHELAETYGPRSLWDHFTKRREQD